MLSKKQMRRLIESVYGKSSKDAQELGRLYARATRQIKAEISQFIQDKVNWQGQPSKDDLDDIRRQLEQLQSDEDISSMVAVFYLPLMADRPKMADLETARIAIPMLHIAQFRHQQLDNLSNQVFKAVARITQEQHRQTPNHHRVPFNYQDFMDKQAKKQSGQHEQAKVSINRDTMETMSKLQQVAKEAAASPKDNLLWANKVEKIITGNKHAGGASARAKMLIRTQACHELNQSTVADFKARGVEKYRFLSLESINTCRRCSSMDYKIYRVKDAQEGVNLPPMHPNCQCWIVEIEGDLFISGSSL